MKKLAILTFFVVSVVFVFGQNGKVNGAINRLKYGELDKAKEAIDLATKHEKTMGKAKTWKVRGFVYQTIATTTDSTFFDLCADPIKVSLEAYEKATELDVKNQYSAEINKNLAMFSLNLGPVVAKDWEDGDFASAHNKFVYLIKISALNNPPVIDTVSMFNAAISAEKAGLDDKALEYFQKLVNIKYGGSVIYNYMANIESERRDTVKFVDYLQQGIEAYPKDNSALMVPLINYYLDKDESDFALQYLSKAIENDPGNHTFYFAQGALYDKLKDFDNAKASYDKAAELKPDYFAAYYNLGALFFNKGADMLSEANNIPANMQAEYEAAVKDSYKELEKALPYLEKAHEIDAEDKSTMQTLKEIYFKLRNDKEEYMTKYKEYNEILKNLE